MTSFDPISTHPVSGRRFSVRYRLAGSETEARARAEDICVEQSVEFPEALVPDGMIRDHLLGRVERLEAAPGGWHEAEISFAVEIAGRELTQLLNVMFGNISLKSGIRVEGVELPEELLDGFAGPRFGRGGLRELLGVAERPLLCTALKPLGYSAAGLAELAYRCALGGIDIIKDDHGLADQGFAPFCERASRCAEAVARANRETGRRAIYAPNVTAPSGEVQARAAYAKAHGAGGLLVAPGLVGLDAMRRLADDDAIGLPIFSHPAFQGSYVLCPDQGLSHRMLFGLLPRLAGADATIYPNAGGRFGFSREECAEIVEGTEQPMGRLKTIFPCPGGGMRLARVPELLKDYGREVVLLIGGDLVAEGPDLIENCRRFHRLIQDFDV